ncbi:hypothetical protein DPMN_154968 [Dreissena polymorpha]|uniref:Uncharacterized protein n=1 Tax=Dreissena polymorpha TaxID=45954 RepID=A0A9D4J7G7_DREPO|nr:hypothetical protein DPMN_056708 [Dreissena polymorpha]KAH3801320.1 hypothetical protein DPMN_154968 [Dreissena polymorpha]
MAHISLSVSVVVCGRAYLGAMPPAKAKEAEIKVNHFLPLVGFQEGETMDAALRWDVALEVANRYMQKTYQPGSVFSNIGTFLTFLGWAREQGLALQNIFDEAQRNIREYLAATRKQVVVDREVERRVAERATLPEDKDIDVDDQR